MLLGKPRPLSTQFPEVEASIVVYNDYNHILVHLSLV